MSFSHKKEGNPFFVTTQIDLKGIMLSETSQVEKDKYSVFSLICGIKTKQNKSWIQREIENRMVVTRDAGVWGMEDAGQRVQILGIRLINSGDLMYSTVITVRNTIYLIVTNTHTHETTMGTKEKTWNTKDHPDYVSLKLTKKLTNYSIGWF